MEDKQKTERADGQCVLITAIVLHYNNGDVIYETIDSILMQDYPRIELIVSDDCSDCFDVDLINDYIEGNKRSNIERVVVRKNEVNLGTVAHLERLRMETSGEIELLIAADDCWHDEGVFSSFAQVFDEIGPEAEFVTSQIEMCDETLQTVESLFVSPLVRQMLLNGDMQSLRDLVSYDCALAGPGSAFRRSFFEKIGSLSNYYTIIEDWSAHVRWLGMGQRIYFLDKITLKHRHGGISHSASSDWPQHFYSYRKDIERIFNIEIEPYKERFSPEAFAKAERAHRFSEACCCSLDNRVSVLILLDGSDSDLAALNSVLWQSNMNYELIIGCTSERAEWVIEKTNSRYTQSPSIKRIKLVLDCEGGPDACRAALEQEAQSSYSIFVPPGKKLSGSSALLSFVYAAVMSRSIDDEPVEYIASSKTKAQALGRSRIFSIAKKKRMANFAQIRKIEEDLLFIFLTLLGLLIVDSYSSGFSGALHVALWVAFSAEAFLLIARIGVFFFRKSLA